MSIYDQAQQLGALADQVPSGQAQSLVVELQDLQVAVAGVLGDTSSANDIRAAIDAAINQVNDLNAALEQVKLTIQEKAQYHQLG